MPLLINNIGQGPFSSPKASWACVLLGWLQANRVAATCMPICSGCWPILTLWHCSGDVWKSVILPNPKLLQLLEQFNSEKIQSSAGAPCCLLVLMWSLDHCSELPLDVQPSSFFPVLPLGFCLFVCFGCGFFSFPSLFGKLEVSREIMAFNANCYVLSVLQQSRT